MSLEKLKRMMHQSAGKLSESEHYLCEIDGETGDGDHGVTIGKIARLIMADIEKNIDSTETAYEFFSRLSSGIVAQNGGSAGTLWAMMFEGMCDIFENYDKNVMIDGKMVKKLFNGALSGIRTISDAKTGDKTMLDALIPAVEAVNKSSDAVGDILCAAAKAAKDGAAATRDMVAKYGRAKNLHEDSRGHLDAGAVSLAILIESLNDAYHS